MNDIAKTIRVKAIFDLLAPRLLPADPKRQFGRLSELSTIFGIGKDRFLEWRLAGKLPAIETAGMELYNFAAVLWWLIEAGFIESGNKAPGETGVVGNNGSHPAPREDKDEDTPGINYEMASIFVDDMVAKLKAMNNGNGKQST